MKTVLSRFLGWVSVTSAPALVTRSSPDVQAMLHSAERSTEQAYAGVRTLVLATLWGLFLSTVDGHHHSIVALGALALYTALTGIAWIAVWRGWSHPVLLFALATLDVLIVVAQVSLLGLMDHGNLMIADIVPAAGLLVLVVAQTTLRFRPVLVLYTGLLGAAVILFTHALALPGARSGAGAFVWTHGGLLPAGVVALVALVLWFQAWRTRTLVSQTIDLASRVGTFARFFSPAVAGRLATDLLDADRRGERREIGVLFADLRGFTAMAEQFQPDELSQFLTELREVVAGCVFRCDATIDKFLGDGVLALFGAHDDRHDPAGCTLHCGLAILEAIDRWAEQRVAKGMPPVDVTVGAHFGEAFVGILGQGGMLEFTAIGDTVNVAQRLQILAARNGSRFVISSRLHALTSQPDRAGPWQHGGLQMLQGRHDPIDVWVLPGRQGPETPVRPGPVRRPTSSGMFVSKLPSGCEATGASEASARRVRGRREDQVHHVEADCARALQSEPSSLQSLSPVPR
jgi:adenylate cyclase